MGFNRITTARYAIGVNARGIVPAGNFAAGAAPCVIECVVGIKVAAGSGRRRRLACHDFGRIDATPC